MFRLNPIVRGGLCASVMSLALPAAAADNDEVLVVTAAATEQSVKDAPRVSASLPRKTCSASRCRT